MKKIFDEIIEEAEKMPTEEERDAKMDELIAQIGEGVVDEQDMLDLLNEIEQGLKELDKEDRVQFIGELQNLQTIVREKKEVV